MFRDSLSVTLKDLRIELRSKVLTMQVIPLVGATIIIFGFALGPNLSPLKQNAAGLIWISILLCSMLAVQRSINIEKDAGSDILKISGFDLAGVFIGKVISVATEIFVIGIITIITTAVAFNTGLHGIGNILFLILIMLLSSISLSALGIVFGAMFIVSNTAETLLPLLYLPLASPILLAATKASLPTFSGNGSIKLIWIGILFLLAVAYFSVGSISFEPLLEDF
jgi:heme exporter protein B